MNTALEKARLRREEMKAQGIEIERLDPIEKAKENPTSLRAAINGKCWDCVGARFDPNPRKRIRECTCGDTCTLHPVRPYQRRNK